MFKQSVLITMAAFGLASSAHAATFLDTFATDTSADYNITGPGSATIAGDVLTATGSGATIDVFHNTARLEVGETVLVDIVSGIDYNLTVATVNEGPNGVSGADGIRLNAQSTSNFRARKYSDGSNESNVDYAGTYDTSNPITLFITRNTDSNFSVGYSDSGSGGLQTLDTFNYVAIGSQDLFIGVQIYNGTATFDDFRIVPEPSSLALLAIGGLTVLRRRRA